MPQKKPSFYKEHGYICLPPYGQTKLTDETLNKAVADSVNYKNSPTTWPSRLPSYEHWCAATLYNELEAGGGSDFKLLMQQLLTESTGSDTNNRNLKPNAKQ